VEAELSKLPVDENSNPIVPDSIVERVDEAGGQFLKLEKFVNINFTGFHKILKKHDKRLPNPCKAFYISRLHQQSWVRGDYSDVIVTLSRIYSIIRGDVAAPPNQDEKQDFVRSTTKYWVHTEHISRVKYIVLQHLPVFLQDSMAGETDAQLVNSVYLDNRSLELYRGRLDKTPGAIALRFRWYGSSIPKVVFVERKTHRESWMGEVSVKERFIVPEDKVFDVLHDTYDKEPELEVMRKKGRKAEDLEEWETLVDESLQAINSKQLEPTMRTQYMRTAFQIPFDATVRVSLDTNLCMINERTENVVSGERWYRDPCVEIPPSEITRFPHAVLEVKLQLENEGAMPEWVTELINSGMLLEVHKFSKFIHGCATLMPDEVQSLPYWIDDATLSESIRTSGGGKLLDDLAESEKEAATGFFGGVDRKSHFKPHDALGVATVRKRPAAPNSRRREAKAGDADADDDAAYYEGDQGVGEHRSYNVFMNFLPAFCGDCFSWAEADTLKAKTQMVCVRITFFDLFPRR
jgi:SPX domain protein involved in polyphosphate accumulation